MYLYTKLQNLKKPIRVAFIGCGKFVSMFLAQYNQLNKIILDSLIEIDIERAKKNCLSSGLSNETIDEINFTENLDNVLEREIDVFIEATGNPIAGTIHAKKIIESKRHVIMVNVEADVLCGKYLSDLAKKNEHPLQCTMEKS